MSTTSYAQIGEDLRLLRALVRVRRGTYIDVGAHHPEFHSVTKLFYDRGWSGINIEPVPSSFATLARERTRDVNLCLAASDRAGTAVLHEIVASGLSTLVERHAERHRRAGWERRTHRVGTRRLDDICAEHAPSRIHFLKIDAEGSEREILLGCDLVRFRPWIVVIEAKEPLSETPTHGEWEPMLLAARYEFAWSDGLNRYYVARERRRLKRALADPPASPASRMPDGAFGRMMGLGALARMFGRN